VHSLDATTTKLPQEHTMPRTRTVHVECTTADGYRWLKRNLHNAAVEVPPNGFRVENEGRWSDLLAAAGGREVLELADRGRGKVVLSLAGWPRKVTGAMGSEPERYIGLTEAQARRLAAKGRP
jgi:hypothetical protein